MHPFPQLHECESDIVRAADRFAVWALMRAPFEKIYPREGYIPRLNKWSGCVDSDERLVREPPDIRHWYWYAQVEAIMSYCEEPDTMVPGRSNGACPFGPVVWQSG